MQRVVSRLHACLARLLSVMLVTLLSMTVLAEVHAQRADTKVAPQVQERAKPPKLTAQQLTKRTARYYDLEEITALLQTELANSITIDERCKAPSERPELDLSGLSFWQVVARVEAIWGANASLRGRRLVFLPRHALQSVAPKAQVHDYARLFFTRSRGVVRVGIDPEPRFPYLRWQKAKLTAVTQGKRVPLKLDGVEPRGLGSELRFFTPRREYPPFEALELVSQGFYFYDWKLTPLRQWQPGAKGKAGKLSYEVKSVTTVDDPKRVGRSALEIRLVDSLQLWQPEDLELHSEEDERIYPQIDRSTAAGVVSVTFGNLPLDPPLRQLQLKADTPQKTQRVKFRVLLDPEQARR